ncbi:hypothetical protein F503_02231 [Ophiostoma piceae UAMH 11346]|uniref:Up-regulated during septation protein 1 domain-containing protein n=1 Tax=Ophiostoma piceae (strain UAMH 11346) TaxID=1262450 RepID=S3BY68_OPHP1|nr:hypothetical protein F503_02231 [Ophiostoma piceae UAMH 11346]
MDHIVRCMLDVDTNDYGDDLQYASYIETNDYPDVVVDIKAEVNHLFHDVFTLADVDDPRHHHHQVQQQQKQQQKQTSQPKPKQEKPPTEEKPYIWRMHSQSERKYQLFPKDKHQPPTLATGNGKGLDPEQAYALAMGATSNSSCTTATSTSTTAAAAGDKQSQSGSGLRLRMKEHSLVRRRKISVPDLGPMTTVQEVAMDSPTIPGRPPLHERSISAPGNSWKQHHLVDCMIHRAYDDIPEQSVYMSFEDLVRSPIEEVPRCSSAQAVLSPTVSAMANSPSLRADSPRNTARQPLSPKVLTPLVIPSTVSHSQSHSQFQLQNQNRFYHQTSSSLSSNFLRPSASATTPLSAQNSRFRSSTTPIENTLRSARSDESPRSRTPFTPYTPMSAVSTTSTLPTPVSATASSATATESNYTISASKDSSASGAMTTGEPAEPRSTTPSLIKISTMPATASLLGHRRGQSDTGSIMERGRPRKRSASREGSTSAAISAMVTAGNSSTTVKKAGIDSSPAPSASASAAAASANTPASSTCASASTSAPGSATPTPGLKRSVSKSGLKNAAERRAFEMLPRGWKASEAPNFIGGGDIAALATQALQQAARFEVLRKEDVDSLSRELRSLDERCEYLRRTYTSLRAGRRNLHGRICQYLRSPRVAKFSHDSMLKQEEALAELDTSIDDWVTKLEQADNRRTRVPSTILEQPLVEEAMATIAKSEAAAAAAAAAVSAKSGPKPAAIATTAVPEASTTANAVPDTPLSPASTIDGLGGRRVDVESIRIYAGDDVYALLADVENQITQMGGPTAGTPAAAAGANATPSTAPAGSSAYDYFSIPQHTRLTDQERRELHRAHSQELLNGGSHPSSKRSTPTPPASPGLSGTSSGSKTTAPTSGATTSSSSSGASSPTDNQPEPEVFLTSAVFRPGRSMLVI